MIWKHTMLVLMLLHVLLYLPKSSSSFLPTHHGHYLERKSNKNNVVFPSLIIPPYTRTSDHAFFRSSSVGRGGVHQTSLKSQVVSSYEAEVNFIRVEEEERKLLYALQLYKTSSKSSEKPSSASFISLIEKWLVYPYPDRAESILDRMEELYTPSGRIYERIINAWTFRAIEGINQIKINDDVDLDLLEEEERVKKISRIREEATHCSSRAIQLLNRMEQLHREIGDDFRPALSTYTSVINSISRTSQKDELSLASQRDIIERIRAKRDEMYKQFQPQRAPIRSVADVFSTIQNLPNADQKLSSRLRLDAQQSPVPNRFNFNLIINALAQTGEIWAAQAAEDILDVMITEFQKGRFQLQLAPNIETFNGCINAWAHCCSTDHQEDAAFRAEAILDKLNMFQTISENGTLTNLMPDTVTYNTIIKAYANRSDAKRAESLLGHLVSMYQKTGDERLRPDLVSYSSVLKAYAKAAAHDPNASKKSEDVLMKMIAMQKEKANDGTRIVNNWCFNTVLNAYAVQGAGARASSLLSLMETMGESDEMLKPDTYSYNTVLKALANSKEKGSVERARQILEKMERRHAEGDPFVKPDTITYNTVILAYANNGGIGAGNAAKDIVERMENRFFQGDLECKPTSSTYTSLIKAFNWEQDSISHAEKVLMSLKSSNPDSDKNPLVRPDTAIYNAVLNCWAKSASRSAVQRAEEILSEMEKEYHENGNQQVKPNCRTYTTMIDILAKSGEMDSPQRSLEILNEMETQYEAGDMDSKPNVFTYTAVINCFARSKDKQKAVQAVNVLQRMEEQYRKGNDSARPNVIAYNTVLNACAYTMNDADAAETAFKIACLMFDEVRTSCHVQPTHVTYGTFLRVCANLMPSSDVKDRLVEATFKRCAKEGLVSNMVWRNLKAAASPLLLSEFLEQANSGLEANWSRNI